MSAYTCRYAAFAAEHGRTPEAQLAHDREHHKGARAMPFMLWVESRWREWLAAHGRRHDDRLSTEDHDAFDAWLLERENAIRPCPIPIGAERMAER